MKIIAELHTNNNGGVFAKIYNEHGELIETTKPFADIDNLKSSVRRLYPTSARKRLIEFRNLTDESLPQEVETLDTLPENTEMTVQPSESFNTPIKRITLTFDDGHKRSFKREQILDFAHLVRLLAHTAQAEI